jgi:hypothetical protein
MALKIEQRYCPIATTLHVSAVIAALAGRVSTVAVVVGLYVPHDPPVRDRAGATAYAFGYV